MPWVAIPPVVTAIRVRERLAPEGGLLFDASVHTIPRGRVSTGRVFGYEAMRHRIEDFTAWASQLAVRLGRRHEVVPEDPHGAKPRSSRVHPRTPTARPGTSSATRP